MHGLERLRTQPDNNNRPSDLHSDRREGSRVKYGDALVDAVECLTSDELHPPILAGKGGEHLVFEVPMKNSPERLRDVVVKVNILKTLDHISSSALNDPVELNEEVKALESDVSDREKMLDDMRRYFGRSAVPAQKYLIADIPVSSKIVRQLRPGWLEPGVRLPHAIPAWVEVQRRIDLDSTKTTSLHGSYLEYEKGPLSRVDITSRLRDYKRMHEVLTGNSTLPTPVQRQAVYQAYPHFQRLVPRMEDPQFESALQDFVKTLITFSRETKIPLDLNGVNNVVLSKNKKNGEWEVKLLDALPIGDFSFDDIDVLVHGLKSPVRLNHAIFGSVMNSLNTVRVVNALAVMAHLPDRLRFDAIQEIPAERWLRMFGHDMV